jgi:regulatory protein
MPVLTDLAPDPRQPGYRLVEVDRGRFASLPAEAIARLELRPGEEVTAPVLQELQRLADTEAAYRAAVRAETRRPHAHKDLRRRLVQKQHPAAAVDAALERLTTQGMLDDRRFAEHFAATRAASGRGAIRLVQDLRRQGVDPEVAREAVTAALAAECIDEQALLRGVAQRRAQQLGALPLVAKRRRLVAFLSRRGYPGEEIRKVVEEVLGRG